MTEKATAIDSANAGKLVQFFDGGWKAGTLIDVRPDTVSISPLGPAGKNPRPVIAKIEDVRLIISAPEPVAKPTKKKRDFVNVPGLGSIELVEASAKKPAKVAKPKAAPKAKAVAKPKPASKPAQAAEVELPATPAHTITLTPVPESKAFTATFKGKKISVVFGERNRKDAAHKFNSVTLSEQALKTRPDFIAVQVRIGENRRWAMGFLLPVALFKKHAHRGVDVAFTRAALADYVADGLAGVRFEEGK